MSVPFLGEIRIFAGSYAPQNWHFCDGTQLDITAYAALFSLLGTYYGGDGITKFGLPDFRGRVPVGQGQGAGLAARQLGQSGGADQVTLAEANLPTHAHALQGTVAAASSPTPAPTLTFGQVPATSQFYHVVPATPTTAAYSAQSVADAGGAVAHPNLMPYLALNYIICIEAGLYPERN
ncbi:MAG: phage tail protein [Ignavibacteria bacterium]